MTAHARKLTQRASGKVPQSPAPANPSNVVRAFAAAFERLGYPADELLAKAGVRREEFEDPDRNLPCNVMGTLVEEAMQRRPVNNLAARLAAETPMGAFPLLDYLVLTSETVGDALKQLARYLRLVGAPYAVETREDEDPVRVLFVCPAIPFSVEFGVTLSLRHLQAETEGRLRAQSVNFLHRPDDASEIARMVGCPVYGGAEWSGFLLSRSMWELPMRRRDPVLRSMLEQHAREITERMPPPEGIEREVRLALASRIARGEVQIESVARALAVSVRSLQRRLAEAGMSYQGLLDATRKVAASEYLSNAALSIGEIGYLLGYSEPAAFHRAFKRWHGVAPQVFRGRNVGRM